ncbi:hypothetical protein [Methylophaga sp.]|uniref:hypothetical protein n=1 Tax=Methylophaga sp. TaxID=2024840 RepID=UPI003F6955A2
MNLLDVLLTSGRVWLFTLIGIAIAAGVWWFLPESSDRLAVSGWAITIGYLVGWMVSMLSDRNTE